MQKLGVVASSPSVDSETVRKNKSTFREPLSASTQEALQLLFVGEFDPLAMNLNMCGLVWAVGFGNLWIVVTRQFCNKTFYSCLMKNVLRHDLEK